MQEIISLLLRVRSTMETISVTGIDNQDKFVGCANAIQTAVGRLEQLTAQEHEDTAAKEVTPDG